MNDPLFILPEIAPAPYTDLGAMMRRLIEHADLSTVRPILDELERLQRNDDRQYIMRLISLIAAANRRGPMTSGLDWSSTGWVLLERFWLDLFDLTESLAVAEKNIRRKPEMKIDPIIANAIQGMPLKDYVVDRIAQAHSEPEDEGRG